MTITRNDYEHVLSVCLSPKAGTPEVVSRDIGYNRFTTLYIVKNTDWSFQIQEYGSLLAGYEFDDIYFEDDVIPEMSEDLIAYIYARWRGAGAD